MLNNDCERKVIKKLLLNKIDQITVYENNEIKPAETPPNIALNFDEIAMKFIRIERISKHEDGKRGSNVEHNFMLSLVAPELAYELRHDIQSRFVCMVDKLLLVIVDIICGGINIMTNNYGVTALDQLKASHAALRNRISNQLIEFPELVHARRLLCGLFEDESFEQAI